MDPRDGPLRRRIIEEEFAPPDKSEVIEEEDQDSDLDEDGSDSSED